MNDNRRNFSRVPFHVHVNLFARDVWYSVERLDDLSVGGCHLPIFPEAPVDDPCEVRIYLNGATSQLYVCIYGKILRHDDDGVGIEFTRIDPDSLFHLQNIIKYNAPDPDAIVDEIERQPGIGKQ